MESGKVKQHDGPEIPFDSSDIELIKWSDHLTVSAKTTAVDSNSKCRNVNSIRIPNEAYSACGKLKHDPLLLQRQNTVNSQALSMLTTLNDSSFSEVSHDESICFSSVSSSSETSSRDLLEGFDIESIQHYDPNTETSQLSANESLKHKMKRITRWYLNQANLETVTKRSIREYIESKLNIVLDKKEKKVLFKIIDLELNKLIKKMDSADP